MHKILLAMVSATAIVSCSNSSMYPDATVVVVDGQEWFARPMKEPNTWQAGPNVGANAGVVVRPALYARNVEVIERVSGCGVIAASVTNLNGYTLAAVDC